VISQGADRRVVAAYGLEEPTLADAQAALQRVHGAVGIAARWAEMLARAGVSDQDDPHSLRRVVDALASEGPVGALCAAALRIRITSFDQLSAVNNTLRSAS